MLDIRSLVFYDILCQILFRRLEFLYQRNRVHSHEAIILIKKRVRRVFCDTSPQWLVALGGWDICVIANTFLALLTYISELAKYCVWGSLWLVVCDSGYSMIVPDSEWPCRWKSKDQHHH